MSEHDSTRAGLLLSCFDYSPVAEDEFHDWYDTEHIPERSRVPGFLDCVRWLAVDRAKASVTTYDLATPAVLRSPGYLAIGYANNSPWTRRVGWRCIKLLRFEGEQLVPGHARAPAEAAALLVWGFNLGQPDDAALAAWYAEEQRPRAVACPGVSDTRLFRASASTHRYVVLHHLASVEIPTTAEWERRIEAPWTARFGANERDRIRILAHRYVRADPRSASVV